MTKKLFFIGLILISGLYLFLRLWDLPKMLDFRADQAIHLSEAKTMIESRDLRLIGPMVTSQSANGRNFFIGANYYYLLGIIGFLFSWNPLSVTVVFIFIELLFYIIFAIFLRQKVGVNLSLATFWFIAISPYLVAHSRFFWNPHLLIPLSIIALISLEKYIDTRKYIFILIAGFAFGFAFSAHYATILWLPIFVFYLYKNNQIKNIKTWLLLIGSFILGDLPFFIFEIRNSFYNLKTFFLVYSNPTSNSGFTSHYLIFPLIIFVIYLLLTRPPRISILIFSVVTIGQFLLFGNYPSLGAVAGWDYPTQVKLADYISKSCPKNFNIAATMQGDTRFYDLRYLLELRGCHLDGVDSYPTTKKLILVSPYTRNVVGENVWEVKSLEPFTINSKVELNSFLDVYFLTRI